MNPSAKVFILLFWDISLDVSKSFQRFITKRVSFTGLICNKFGLHIQGSIP